MAQIEIEPHIFVIIGATGDLAKRKILPAMYNLAARGALGEKSLILDTARRQLQDEEFRDLAKESLKYVKNLNLKVSLALNSETPVDVVLPYADQVDAFQVLTVHPDTFCIEFLPEPIEKIKRLREINDTIPIEADGCLNPEHIKPAKSAGANIFCSGSYIFKSDDVDTSIKELVEAAQ